MTREQKIEQTLRLVAAVVTGYSAQENRKPTGLVNDAWVHLFENCYQAVGAMTARAEQIEPVREVKS